MDKTTYALRFILVSIVFIAFTLGGFSVLGGHLTWLEAGIVTAIFAIADASLIVYTSRQGKGKHADTSQSTR